MSIRMRHTKGHTGNRRSHHGLEEPRLSECNNCGHSHLRHRMCKNCGQYRGKEIIDMEARLEKKQEKMKRKEKEMEEMGMAKKSDEEKPYTGKDKKKADKDPDQSMLKKSRERGSAPLDAKDLSKRPEK